VTPLRIDVTSASPRMVVGSSQQFTATAVDVNEQPIPGVTFRWQVSGANGGNTRAAAVDNNGLLTSSGIGLMTVHAQIVYSGQTSDQLTMFEGLAQVDIEARKEYQLHRLLTNPPLERPLALRPSYNSDPAINDSGQLAFTGDFDGLGI